METRNVYITSVEGDTGKSTVALGVLDTLTHEIDRVGVFRPVARSTSERDYVLEMLLDHDGVELSYEDCIGVGYDEVHADPDAALSRIVERYKAVEARCSAVVILGSDYTDVGTPTELSFNARVAANLGAPVVLVLGGRASGQGGELGSPRSRTADELAQVAEVAVGELHDEHASLLAVVANRVEPAIVQAVRFTVGLALHDENVPVWAIPEDPMLVAPTMQNLMDATGGTLIKGDAAMLQRSVFGVVIAAMSMVNVLPRLTEGSVVVVPGDRVEVLVAALLAQASGTFPSLAGILLNGGFEPPASIERLIEGVEVNLPIVATNLDTYETTLRVTQSRGRLAAESPAKFEQALALFERSVDRKALVDLLEVPHATITTPLMFEHKLLEEARAAGSRIVLPEGDDDRILLAADRLLRRDVAKLTILGDEAEIRARALSLGADLTDATIISPFDPELRERFAEEYTRLRGHKGVTIDIARNVVTDVSYFGTLMVHLGLADGMVSGAAHTTAHTIRPSFEIIRTKPGVSVVSSVFLMALADRVLVYGDCAVIPDPTSEQLADIAISSATTAAAFGIDPRVAMLSYSTGQSGEGADVEKVRAATALVRERRPDLLVEGPIQYDAAADAAVAAAKLPESEVAGRATVFVFPDLNTGNNTYKAVQRSAGAVAIGPVLQGLNKPVNDLSRGALVQDIVNTVAITAIQAGQQEGRSTE
nr:phosphate acetyltransferase [Herbiconiux sp. L3-i23]